MSRVESAGHRDGRQMWRSKRSSRSRESPLVHLDCFANHTHYQAYQTCNHSSALRKASSGYLAPLPSPTLATRSHIALRCTNVYHQRPRCRARRVINSRRAMVFSTLHFQARNSHCAAIGEIRAGLVFYTSKGERCTQ